MPYLQNTTQVWFEDNATISLWIKSSVRASGGLFYGGAVNNFYGFYVTVNNPMRYGYNLNASIGVVCIPTVDDVGNWTHIVLTKEGANGIKFYRNGVNCANDTENSAGRTDAIKIINGNNQASSNGITGNLDEIKLWNKTLSTGEILDIYRNESIGTRYVDIDKLILDMRFEETSSSMKTANDSSGNNNSYLAKNVFMPSQTTGKYGNGMNFISDVVGTLLADSNRMKVVNTQNLLELGYNQSALRNNTISVWIKPNSNSAPVTSNCIFGGHETYRMDLSQLDRTIRWRVWSADGYTWVTLPTTGNSLTAGEWTHVVVTNYQNSTGMNVSAIYINGVLSGTANQASGAPAVGTSNVIIGNN
ncbi:MAG: LamG domain-containing protein, partial [archaeon]|nr:LamG domain-containing protein [archaeon]